MINIEEPVPPAPRGWALWNLGFRPFYLVASIFAALSVVLWACEYAGWLPGSYVQTPFRHAHEMLFGYTLAVVAGFLFTAVRNWTSQPTPTGGALMAIVLLWICGRVMMLTPFAVASAVVNAAFPLAVAVGIGRPLVRAGNRRNYFFIAALVVL
ncbi:MAG TPA: NnrS family protein, partial [Usitatibacter sp.]|nr:NnrS family protein [Usitatibacter sp.]